MKKIIFLIVTIVLFETPAMATYFYSASQMKDYCNGSPGSVYRSVCNYYVAGVISTDQLFADLNNRKTLSCLPKEATPTTLGDVVKTYLNAETEDMNQNASGHVLIAIMRAFPCNK